MIEILFVFFSLVMGYGVLAHALYTLFKGPDQ